MWKHKFLFRILESAVILFWSCVLTSVSAQDKLRSDTDSIVSLRSTQPPFISLAPTISPSPQAETFKRVGEFSVNNASGIPDISIPLFDINHYGYNIPLTLRYLATPLKPGYNHDVTGHGWSFTFGSCISRTIYSVPDENFNFRLSTDKMQDFYQYVPNGINNQIKDYNFQFDRFFAKLPDGNTFSFCICNDQYNGLRYVVSDSRYKNIQCNYSTGNISGFILYDVNGVKYTFDIADYSLEASNYGVKTSWYLSRIDLPNSNIPILLTYGANVIQRHFDGLEEPILVLGNQFSPYPEPENENKAYASLSQASAACNYKVRLLTNISCGNTSVVFNYQDTSAEPEYNYLRSIAINYGGQTKRHFRFDYNRHYVMGKYVSHLKRLSVKGYSNSPDSLVYNFGYTGIGGFLGTDHWGNCSDNQYGSNIANMNIYVEFNTEYNSHLNSSQLITILQKNPTDPSPYNKLKIQGIPTVNEPRRATQPGSHGILRSITYPTGGRTEFEFENHRFVTATAANGDYIATKRQRRVIEGGGFRIKTITNYTSDNKVADVRQFRYGPTYYEANQQNMNLPGISGINTNQHIGFGEPVVDPNILTYSRFSTSNNIPSNMQNMLLGLGPAGQHNGFSNDFYSSPYNGYSWKWECRFSPIYFRALLNGRNAVVYPEITEYFGDIGASDNTPEKTTGKIVYEYDIYDANGDSAYFSRLEYIGNVLSVDESNYHDDNLTKKTTYSNEYVYSGVNKQVAEDTYTYATNGGNTYSEYVFNEHYLAGFYPNPVFVYTLFGIKHVQVGSSVLTSHTTTRHTNNGSISTTEALTYNENGLVTQRTSTGAKNTYTTYTYPSMSDQNPIVQQMLSNKMLSTVLQSTTKTTGSSSFDVSGYKVDYADFNACGILPSCLYRLSVVNGIGSGFEQEEQVLSYTSNGNPVETVDRSGMHTVYLWGYNDSHPVAMIKNATSSQVATVLGSSSGTALNGHADGLGTSLRTLLSTIQNAMVSTWTFCPLVGMTSETDASGMSTYYSYDTLGRLTEIYRYEGNIVSPSNKQTIKQYSYHTIAN